MRTKKRVRRYFDGGSFGNDLQTLTNTVNQSLISYAAQQDAKKLAERQRLEQERDMLNSTKRNDTALLKDYETDGRLGAEYYMANGGKLSTPSYYSTGGKLTRLSSDTELVEGNTHAEGGVKLKKGGGTAPFAEVEDEEVIKDGKRVYSDRLRSSNGKTFAENVEALSTEKGKLEKLSTKGDAISRGTNKRRIEILDAKEDAFYQEQESLKSSEPTMGYYDLGGVLDSVSPYVDNIANAVLTLATPKLRKPVTMRHSELNTKVNVTDQLNDINKAVDSSADFIMKNTSNSASARNAIAKTRLQGAAQKAKVRAYKENAETQLENANIRNKQFVDARNSAILNRFNDQQTARQGAIQSRISQNFSNLAGDYVDRRNSENIRDYNNKKLAIVKSMYKNGSGVVQRADDNILKELLNITGQNSYAYGGDLGK